MEVIIKIPDTIIRICKENGVTSEKNIIDVYTNFIEETLGRPFNIEHIGFDIYCQNTDNIVDYITE